MKNAPCNVLIVQRTRRAAWVGRAGFLTWVLVVDPPVGIEPTTYSLLPRGRITLYACLRTYGRWWLFGSAGM